MAEVAVAFEAIETAVQGAIAVAKGVYDPTLPLRATLVPLKDVSISRSFHTSSIIKGRAYIFGGKYLDDNGMEIVANNDMEIIILPSSGIESTDYKKITSGNDAPCPRYGHSAVVIDDNIFIYGGSNDLDGTPVDEPGLVWNFDTTTSHWTKLMPSSKSSLPSTRHLHASVATDAPRDTTRPMDEGTMPQMPPDPARNDMLPEPQAATSYGTLFVYGGVSNGSKDDPLTDIYAFDMATRTWTEYPSPPLTSTASPSPTLALLEKRLYTYSNGQTHYMDLTTSTSSLEPPSPWSPFNSASTTSPNAVSGAAFVPVTTGQGRNYLLLIGGESSPPKSTSTSTPVQISSIWALQLKPSAKTAASIKDAARNAISKSTGETEWAEVRYYGPEGVMIQEGQDGRGIGARKGFAVARGEDIDGFSVLVWGGEEMGEDGRRIVLGNGIMITVDR